MKFYLGLHQPGDAEKTRYPVFVSVSRLIKRIKPLDHSDWIMDSGGFTMISKHGEYTISEVDYLNCIKNHNPRIAFCQDWMCEEFILKKTNLTVKDHQVRTIISYLSLSDKDSRIRPVLQGWEVQDYLKHVEMYQLFGVDINQLFGLGTICSRNFNPEIIFNIVSGIKSSFPEIQLHGFGVKSDALVRVSSLLESADSMAWSANGRRTKLCPDCVPGSCANCLEFALLWRKKLINSVKAEILLTK